MFSTSLRSRFRNNDPPSVQETAEVKKAFGIVFGQVRALEDEIARLQNKRKTLEIETKDLEAFMDGHTRLLSPARKLLPEILQEIFFYCLPVAHNAVLDAKEAPLLLGRVCSQWRRIAYSTPRLWTSIHIIAYPIDSTRRSASCREIARIEAISSWLSRSGILPLSISMYCILPLSISISNAKWMQMSMDQFRPYFELITKHARRWRSIRVQIPFADMRNFLMELDADNFPLLEGFHVDRGILGKVGMLNHPLSRKDGILSAPSLRVLSINKISRLLDLPVQWSLLKGLDL
ncbi:hypothetical protein AGABI1DRAFT_46515, partial [Agaricus bisporus var. burnettii JB137-S8]